VPGGEAPGEEPSPSSPPSPSSRLPLTGLQGGAAAGAGGGGGVGGPPVGFLTVGEMSHMGRGMHTTTTATLIRLQGGGLLADTPGGEEGNPAGESGGRCV
jgi:hypothetical protein